MLSWMKGAKPRPGVGRKVILVGHCTSDRFALAGALKRAVPGAALEKVNDDAHLDAVRTPEHVWLVNRELDGRFHDDCGIELIKRTATQPDAPILILVSDHDDAQDHATKLGAKAGFGKSALRADETKTIIEAAVLG